MHDKHLSGKVAVITGASSGIGRAIALALAPYGASLALASRRQAELEQVAALARERGSQALVHPTDMTDPVQISRLAEAVLDQWGQIDLLILSQGQYIHGSIHEIGAADLEKSLQVNFYGCYHAVQAALPSMLKRHAGHIIFISSLIAKKALPYDIPYVTAKYALSGFAEALRQELHGSGVAITTIFPARVATAFVDDLDLSWMARPDPPEAVAKVVLKAIRTRKPEMIMPFKSYLLFYLNVISPGTADWAARIFHLESRMKSGSPTRTDPPLR